LKRISLQLVIDIGGSVSMDMNMKIVLVVALLAPLAGCTYIRDTRSSNIVQIDQGDGGVLLDDISTLEHSLWDVILEAASSPEGMDYDALVENGEHRYVLGQYLSMLGQIDPRALVDGDEKAAYYVNLYNATVVEGVLERLETSPDFRVDEGGFEFFDSPLVELEGRLYSLNVLEHALIRGDMGHSSQSVSSLDEEGRTLAAELHADLWSGAPFDPRLHFLLNCASVSCPPLQTAALRGESFEATAEGATEEFLLDPFRGAGPDGISQLFNWFAGDITAAGWGSSAQFIEEYRSLDDVDTETFLPYDWALNRRRTQ
jgi:hypothetical protein